MDNNCDKDRDSEHISCWTHFYIRSVGEYSSDKGYVSKKEDTFDPDELTELLGIKPRNAWKYGDHVELSSNPNRTHRHTSATHRQQPRAERRRNRPTPKT